MTLLYILAAVFAGVGIMVLLTERFGKPMAEEEQRKYGKIVPILIFIMLIGVIIREMIN